MANIASSEAFSETERLQSNSFGWFGQLFQSIAHMAPAIAVVSALPFMASRAGSALPLAMVFAGILAICLAYCLAQLTKKFYGASGYFQIHSQAIGSRVGFTTSWLFLIYEPLNLFSTAFGFGVFILEPFSDAYLGMHIAWWWAPLIANVIATILCLVNIKKSMWVTGVLASIEVLIFITLGALILLHSNSPIQPQYFHPSTSADGMGGLLFAFVWGFLCFIGYESGLPLTEETKKTTVSTAKGLMWSVGFATLFYIFVAYITVLGFGGGNDSAGFAQAFSTAANPYGILTLSVFGIAGPWILFFAALNSTLASGVASTNAATRVMFALGRARILPAWLGKTTETNKVPKNSIFAAFTISLALTALGIFLSRGGDQVAWFGLIGVLLVLPLLIIHLVTCVSVFMAYRKSGDFNMWRHGVLPLITGIMVLLPIWGAVYYNQQAPMSYAPWIVAIWFCIGVGIYFWLRSARPQTLTKLEGEMATLKTFGLVPD